MGKVADRIAEKAQLARAKPTSDDIIEQSGDLLATVCLAHDIPVDFIGVTMSALREPGTNRLLAVILSPVDMYGDEPFARYEVSLDHVKVAKPNERKIVLPG